MISYTIRVIMAAASAGNAGFYADQGHPYSIAAAVFCGILAIASVDS